MTAISLDDKFSKFRFMDGRYGPADFADLDTNIIRDYCMDLSLRSREQVEQHG